MRNLMILLAMLVVVPVTGRAGEVPLAHQTIAKGAFRDQFVLPDQVLWRFDKEVPYPAGGDVVCGAVNFQNSNRIYIGYKSFYAVIRHGEFSEGGIVGNQVQDPTGNIQFAFNTLCNGK